MIARRPSEAPSDRPATLSRRALRDVAREVMRLQRSFPHSRDRGRLGDRGQLEGLTPPYYIGLVPAVVTTAIPACSSSGTPDPGVGAAQLWYWDDDVESMVQDGDDGMGGATDGIVSVLNWYQNSGTIAVGVHILVATFANAWWLIGADC